jgi:hypothetical protein
MIIAAFAAWLHLGQSGLRFQAIKKDTQFLRGLDGSEPDFSHEARLEPVAAVVFL